MERFGSGFVSFELRPGVDCDAVPEPKGSMYPNSIYLGPKVPI